MKYSATPHPKGAGGRDPSAQKPDSPAGALLDGRFEITLSADRMRAFISLSPSRGGEPLSVEKVKRSLQALKVVYGVNEELLKRLIDNVERTKDEKKGVIIAQGLLPEEGKDGRIEFHLGKKAGPAGGPSGAGGNGPALGGIILSARADKGDLVASLVKSIPGKDGRDVCGNPVPAPKPKDPVLAAGANIRVDRGSLYVMGIDGVVEVFRDESGSHRISARPFADGTFAIRIPDGDMEVLLDVIPSVGGGRPVGHAEVLEECAGRGITAAVDVAAVREAVERAEKGRTPVQGVLIAAGVPPVHGANGSVQFPVRIASGRRLSLRADGSVDHKEQDLYTTVEKGTILAVLTKPGKAVRDGVTVKGRAIQAKDGRGAELSAGSNTLVEERDGVTRFVAAIEGRLFLDGKSVSVEPVMVVQGDVGPKTGNVRFNGVVEVSGDVLDGFLVHGKKGLIVRGNVGNARLVSEGSVTVMGGVIGKGAGAVSAGGNISVKFAENAHLEARGDIVVHRAAMNCSMLSGGKIEAVSEKGQIVGGELRARLGVAAKTLGNESEHRTDIFVGSDFFVERTLVETRRRLAACAAEQKAIDFAVEKAAREGTKHDPRPDSGGFGPVPQREPAPTGVSELGTAERLRRRASIAAEMEELKRVENECLVKLNELFDAMVTAHENLFKGVRVHIGGCVYEPDGTRTRAKIAFDKEQRRIDAGRV